MAILVGDDVDQGELCRHVLVADRADGLLAMCQGHAVAGPGASAINGTLPVAVPIADQGAAGECPVTMGHFHLRHGLAAADAAHGRGCSASMVLAGLQRHVAGRGLAAMAVAHLTNQRQAGGHVLVAHRADGLIAFGQAQCIAAALFHGFVGAICVRRDGARPFSTLVATQFGTGQRPGPGRHLRTRDGRLAAGAFERSGGAGVIGMAGAQRQVGCCLRAAVTVADLTDQRQIGRFLLRRGRGLVFIVDRADGILAALQCQRVAAGRGATIDGALPFAMGVTGQGRAGQCPGPVGRLEAGDGAGTAGATHRRGVAVVGVAGRERHVGRRGLATMIVGHLAHQGQVGRFRLVLVARCTGGLITPGQCQVGACHGGLTVDHALPAGWVVVGKLLGREGVVARRHGSLGDRAAAAVALHDGAGCGVGPCGRQLHAVGSRRGAMVVRDRGHQGQLRPYGNLGEVIVLKGRAASHGDLGNPVFLHGPVGCGAACLVAQEGLAVAERTTGCRLGNGVGACQQTTEVGQRRAAAVGVVVDLVARALGKFIAAVGVGAHRERHGLAAAGRALQRDATVGQRPVGSVQYVVLVQIGEHAACQAAHVIADANLHVRLRGHEQQ